MRAAILLCALSALQAQEGGFVRVPSGQFAMGCPAGMKCAEGLPRKLVEVREPFWLSRTETTVAQFRAFVRATGYVTTAERAGGDQHWRNPGFRLKDAQPVTHMSMDDAEAYCQWAGGRLPTEAEWEYAARAGSESHHYWGEEMDERYLWYRANSPGHPMPVGRKLPNAWGLYDMEGNVWEWVSPSPPHTSITLAGHGSIRGGGWMTCPEPYPPVNGIRSRQIGVSVPFENFPRQNFKRDWHRDDSGFRCARTARRE